MRGRSNPQTIGDTPKLTSYQHDQPSPNTSLPSSNRFAVLSDQEDSDEDEEMQKPIIDDGEDTQEAQQRSCDNDDGSQETRLSTKPTNPG